VIGYTMEDFTAGRVRHDVILDDVDNRPLRQALTPRAPG
jgi:hypothetical protein